MCRGWMLGAACAGALSACASGGSGAPRTESAAAASAEIRTLREQNRQQRERIDELVTRQAILESQLRRLRRGDDDGVTADASSDEARPTLRAGPTVGTSAATDAARSDRSRRRRIASATPDDERAAPPDVTSDAGDVGDAAEDDGPRPVLRIHGAADQGAANGEATPPGSSAPGSQPAMPPIGPPLTLPPQMPAPMLPPGIPSALPTAPVPDLPASALFPAAPSPSAPSPYAAAVPEYQVALGYVRQRRFDDALAALSVFLERHPAHPYADNALYWRGEVHYARRSYREAIRDFASVVERYPQGNKVADALLKIGMSYARLGDSTRARAYLDRVVREFPGSQAAAAARREVPR